jgi:hypothetical protein
MSGHLEMSAKERKRKSRKSMFDEVFKKWLPSSFIPRPSRHPCESRGPVSVHRAPLASLLDSCLRRNDGETPPLPCRTGPPTSMQKQKKKVRGLPTYP